MAPAILFPQHVRRERTSPATNAGVSTGVSAIALLSHPAGSTMAAIATPATSTTPAAIGPQ